MYENRYMDRTEGDDLLLTSLLRKGQSSLRQPRPGTRLWVGFWKQREHLFLICNIRIDIRNTAGNEFLRDRYG